MNAAGCPSLAAINRLELLLTLVHPSQIDTTSNTCPGTSSTNRPSLAQRESCLGFKLYLVSQCATTKLSTARATHRYGG